MEIKSIGPSFGMSVVKTENARKLINQLPYDKAMEIQVMEMDAKKNGFIVHLSTFVRNGKERLQAIIGPKTYTENFFRSRVNVVRKATKYADKIFAEQKATQELTKGMTIPRLG